MTPSQLRRLADQAERRAAELEREAKLLREQATELRRLAGLAERSGLPIGKERSMIGSKMEVDPGQSRRVKIAAGRTRNETDAKAAIILAGQTDQTIADELGVGRSTVNAWLSGRRSIPDRHQQTLLAKHGIPLSVWPRRAK